MSTGLQLAIAIGAVLTFVGLLALVRWQARAMEFSPEVQRKLVHIATGLFALTYPWLFPDRWPVFLLLGACIVVLILLRLPILQRGGLGDTLHAVERRSYGDFLLAISIGTVFLLADGRAVLYVLPLAILTLSDAAAALTGSAYGRKFFAVEDGVKSIEGSVAFFVTSFCLSMICLLLLSDTPRVNVITLSAIVAAFGTLVEADSWRGFDNFFVPAGLMVFLEGHLDTEPMHLLGIMAGFGLAIWLALALAPRLKISAHIARVYVIAGFLLLSVVDPEYAVLPLLVFVAHGLACRLSPCDARHPELDVVAAVALLSFFWLVLGRSTNVFNIEVYGLTALAMAVSFVTLAAAPRGSGAALAAGAVASGVVAALFDILHHTINRSDALTVSWLALALAVTLAVVIPTLWSAQFRSDRTLRVTGLALVVPLGLYILQSGGLGG
ncbi:MAG: hypothetical protein AAFY39_06410 [Pseudomonadota bacterium]